MSWEEKRKGNGAEENLFVRARRRVGVDAGSEAGEIGRGDKGGVDCRARNVLRLRRCLGHPRPDG